jgi:hypothetical protein
VSRRVGRSVRLQADLDWQHEASRRAAPFGSRIGFPCVCCRVFVGGAIRSRRQAGDAVTYRFRAQSFGSGCDLCGRLTVANQAETGRHQPRLRREKHRLLIHRDVSGCAWLLRRQHQHEIAGDEPLPTTGSPYETRKPSGERGVQNILFVIGEFKKRRPDLDYGQLLLVGHSHGGDTSMLFAQEDAALVHTVISLDNRRMPFPRARKPRILSLRSSDQPADGGVIPSAAQQAKFELTVIKLPATIRNDMWDGASVARRPRSFA